MKILALVFTFTSTSVTLAAESVAGLETKMSYVDNGKIRLGVDLLKGGAVTYLSSSGSTLNLINSWDLGRQIQMSFYSGPVPYAPKGGNLAPMWKDLGWNPIQSGDHYRNPSKVVEHHNDGKKIFVRCIPMIYPLENVPAECVFETTYILNGHTVEVTARLINHREDTIQYPARIQESPAIYSNGPWYRLVTYMGDQPFTGGEVTTLVDRDDDKGWPWFQFYAPERWAALLDEKNEGLGVYHFSSHFMTGGFSGKKGTGGPNDPPTGYVSPLHDEILDATIDYSFRYVLILGSLDEIRNYAYEQEKKKEKDLPAWEFISDRQHWHYEKTTDSGWPIKGELQIQLGLDAQMVSPQTFWRAEDAPILEVEAAFPADAKTFHVIIEPFTKFDAQPWLAWGEKLRRPESPRLAPVAVEIKPGSVFERYRIDLTKVEGYHGAMVRTRLALPRAAGTARVRSVALKGK